MCGGHDPPEIWEETDFNHSSHAMRPSLEGIIKMSVGQPTDRPQQMEGSAEDVQLQSSSPLAILDAVQWQVLQLEWSLKEIQNCIHMSVSGAVSAMKLSLEGKLVACVERKASELADLHSATAGSAALRAPLKW